MPRDLETTLVCLLDRGAQFRTRYMRVDLERGHAAIRPIGHGLTRVLRPREFLHLEIWIVGPIQIGAGDVQMWAGKDAPLDGLLEFQVRIRLHTARRAHG